MIRQYKNYKSFIDNVVKLLQGRKVRYISAKTGNAYNTVEEAVKDNTKYVKDPSYRYLIKEQKVRKPKEYNIPFIKDKKIILTNAGLASGAVLSTNMLDTIAKHAEAAGLPINIAIGLSAKESTLGNPTFDKSIYKILNPQRRKIYELFKNGQHINNGNDIPERELINWTRDELGPYGLTMFYLTTKRKTQELYNAALEASEKYDDGRVKDYEDTYADTNVLFNGFKFYKEHPDLYNPGLPNYLELVNQRAKEIWQSPEIQEWYKQYLTNKKIKSLKQGGQIRKMLTASGGPLKKPRIKLNGLWRELNYEGNGDFSTLTENGKMSFTTGQKSPKSIVGNKEIVVTPEQTTVLDKLDNTKNYYSTYNPDDIIKGFNALTLGGLNNLSPTLWARRYYDLNQLLLSLIPGSKRTMTWSGFVNNWLNGNNGLVSLKFAEEHPYLSMTINGVGDVAAFGGLANAEKINNAAKIANKAINNASSVKLVAKDVAKTNANPYNWRKYRFIGDDRFYSDLDNYGIKNIMMDREKGTYPLTFAERRNYITNLKSDIQKGVDYAIDEARKNVKTPLKSEKEVEYFFGDGFHGWRWDPYTPEDILPQKMLFGTRLSTIKRFNKKTPWEGNYGAFRNQEEGLFFPFRNQPNTLKTHSMFLDVGERIGTGAHETRHTVLSYFDTPLVEIRDDLGGSYGRYTNRDLPLDFRKKVNSYINDAKTAGEWEGSLNEMDAELTGWGARYGIPSKYSLMTPLLKALVYDLFQKRFGGTTDYKNWKDVDRILKGELIKPIKLYEKNLDNSEIGLILQGLEQLGYRKQGGILEFLKNGGQVRKMQTASGGPLRIKFTPEQIAEFENQATRVPGTNNSGRDRYREEGVLALQHLEQEAKGKEEEIKSRMEMRPTPKRKVTTAEKLQGKKDEYELTPLVVGMSGADPLLSFYVGGIGLNGIGALAKTGLWNIAKYAPTTQLGNWGRLYFVGNTFKNSFNGTVPTLTSLLASKNLFRTKVYKGGEIEDPYSNFLTTDPKYAANYGKVSPYIFESKSVAKAKEPMMGSSDPVTMDMFVYNNTKGNPNATAIIGHDKVTGEFAPSRGIEIYSMSPTNLFKVNNPEKGKIFTGFKEQQGLLDMMNNSHNAPHPPIYERVSYSKYSADAANPKERDLVILHFKSRYPNSGLQLTSPLKISGFTYDNLLKVGELPLSEEGKAIADVMARRMKNYKLREGLDPNIVHFGGSRLSRSGIDGMMNQIKNDKTIAYMPLKNSDNYGGLYEGGEAFLKLNPWREKPYIYSLIHEGVSHMTDDFVNDLRTPVSGKKLLSDLSRNFDGTKASDSMYGRISYPNDIYDEKLIEKILHKDSMKAIESRSTNWEMITDLYRILAKEKGISYKLATELPDSEFGAFVEKTLDSPEKLSKFMEKFDNLYLLDYSNLMKAGTKELANKFYKRIKGMLKYGPSLITGGYFLTSQKQGGKMNVLEFLKNGSGIHIKKKNRGKFTSYCGGKVTDECIRKAKASGNPTLVKRATFADNARHFKHRLGGLIVKEFKLRKMLNNIINN